MHQEQNLFCVLSLHLNHIHHALDEKTGKIRRERVQSGKYFIIYINKKNWHIYMMRKPFLAYECAHHFSKISYTINVPSFFNWMSRLCSKDMTAFV